MVFYVISEGWGWGVRLAYQTEEGGGHELAYQAGCGGRLTLAYQTGKTTTPCHSS